MSGKGRFVKKGQGKGKKTQAKGGNSNAATANKKQFVTDYNFYFGSANQASDYEITTEFLINYIKKFYDYGIDIGMAHENMESLDTAPWKPCMQVSTEEDEASRIAENRQFEIEFMADYNTYSKRVQTHKNNKTKAYALLWYLFQHH